jgi:hypothetical protein
MAETHVIPPMVVERFLSVKMDTSLDHCHSTTMHRPLHGQEDAERARHRNPVIKHWAGSTFRIPESFDV